MGKLIGFPVELTIGQAFMLKTHRHNIWGAFYLFFKQLVDTAGMGIIGCGIIPLYEEQAPLLLRE